MINQLIDQVIMKCSSLNTFYSFSYSITIYKSMLVYTYACRDAMLSDAYLLHNNKLSYPKNKDHPIIKVSSFQNVLTTKVPIPWSDVAHIHVFHSSLPFT